MTQPEQFSLEEQFKHTDILQKISSIHKLNINIYDLEGKFIATSDTNNLINNKIEKGLLNKIITQIKNPNNIAREIQDKKELLDIYTVLYINKRAYGILNIPYNSTELNDINKEIKTEVLVLVKIYTFLFVMSGLIAIFLLKQITKPLKILTQKLKNVEITKKNEPIFWL